MAVAPIVKTNVSGTITLEDATTPTPVALTLAFDRGDVSVSGVKEVLNEPVAVERRGRYISSGHGARVYPTITFSSWISQFQATAVPGDLIDYLLRKGPPEYQALVSTLGAGAKVPFACDATYNLEGTDFGDATDHSFKCHDVEWTSVDFQEEEGGLFVSVSGIVRGEIDGDISAAEIV